MVSFSMNKLLHTRTRTRSCEIVQKSCLLSYSVCKVLFDSLRQKICRYDCDIATLTGYLDYP